MTPEQVKVLISLHDARFEIELYAFDHSRSEADRETCEALAGLLTQAIRTFGSTIKS